MKKARFTDQRESRFNITQPTQEDPTLVVCPHCQEMATVFLLEAQPKLGFGVKVTCSHCGFNKTKETSERKFYWYEDQPSDSYFDYPLWMVIPCCGESLWAYNHRHLSLLENFVAAEHRENPKDNLGYANSSLASRLPKWLKSHKNRKNVLNGLSKLRALGKLTINSTE